MVMNDSNSVATGGFVGAVETSNSDGVWMFSLALWPCNSINAFICIYYAHICIGNTISKS